RPGGGERVAPNQAIQAPVLVTQLDRRRAGRGDGATAQEADVPIPVRAIVDRAVEPSDRGPERDGAAVVEDADSLAPAGRRPGSAGERLAQRHALPGGVAEGTDPRAGARV